MGEYDVDVQCYVNASVENGAMMRCGCASTYRGIWVAPCTLERESLSNLSVLSYYSLRALVFIDAGCQVTMERCSIQQVIEMAAHVTVQCPP